MFHAPTDARKAGNGRSCKSSFSFTTRSYTLAVFLYAVYVLNSRNKYMPWGIFVNVPTPRVKYIYMCVCMCKLWPLYFRCDVHQVPCCPSLNFINVNTRVFLGYISG